MFVEGERHPRRRRVGGHRRRRRRPHLRHQLQRGGEDVAATFTHADRARATRPRSGCTSAAAVSWSANPAGAQGPERVHHQDRRHHDVHRSQQEPERLPDRPSPGRVSTPHRGSRARSARRRHRSETPVGDLIDIPGAFSQYRDLTTEMAQCPQTVVPKNANGDPLGDPIPAGQQRLPDADPRSDQRAQPHRRRAREPRPVHLHRPGAGTRHPAAGQRHRAAPTPGRGRTRPAISSGTNAPYICGTFPDATDGHRHRRRQRRGHPVRPQRRPGLAGDEQHRGQRHQQVVRARSAGFGRRRCRARSTTSSSTTRWSARRLPARLQAARLPAPSPSSPTASPTPPTPTPTPTRPRRLPASRRRPDPPRVDSTTTPSHRLPADPDAEQ